MASSGEAGAPPPTDAAGAWVSAAGAGPGKTLSPEAVLALTEAGCDWLWETDADLRFSWLSDNYQAATGIHPSNALGRFRFDFLKQALNGSRAVGAHLDALQAHKPFRDFVYELKDGREDCRWISTTGIPCFDAAGTFVGYRGLGRNVTAIAASVHTLQAEADSGERDRAGQQLSDLQRVIDTVDMGIVVLDADLNTELINRAFYSAWDMTPDLVQLGAPFRRLLDFDRRNGLEDVEDSEWERYVADRLAEVRSGDMAPREFTRADGRSTIYSVTVLSGGKRMLTYYDVTEMKAREAQLAEALERARLAEAVIDSVPNPMFVKDAQLTYVMANQAFADFFDTTPERIVGNKDRDLVAPHERDMLEEQERRVIESGELYEVEMDFVRDDAEGARIVRKNRVRTSSGKTYLAASIFDVSESRRREKEAEEARKHLAYVLESLPAAVIIYDRHDNFVFANRKLQDSWPALQAVWRPGCTLREAFALGHANGYFRDSGDKEADKFYDLDVGRWLDGMVARYHLPAFFSERQNPDGRWYQVYDMRTQEGTFIGVRVDITELKEREAELRETRQRAVLADRAKSEFLANMSHEIRTPMNGVLGMAELLAKSDLDPKQKTFTDIIVKSGNALLTIINDILDFSKIDAGQLMLDPTPFSLAEAIEDVATLVSSRAKEKDLELIVRIAPGLDGRFVGDVGRIRQIITNLLGNAVKFTEEGHVLIDVTGERKPGGTRLHISVTDTGIGIAEEKCRLIFEKFSQVDASSTRRHEGTGLGLAITSRLVELMRGEIGVESAEGKGSTFWFAITLPDAAQTTVQRIPPIDVTGARVLVVDDNAVNRSILSEQMAAWKFDSCAAASGAEGLRVLLAAAAYGVPVDCIVLDYQMPGMTGADMARIVRNTDKLSDTPIIMLTSVDQSLANIGYRDLEIDAHLIKPARSSILLQALVEAIQRRRVTSEMEDGPAVAPVDSEPAALMGVAAEQPEPEICAAAPQPLSTVFPGDGRQLDILVAEDNEVNQMVFTQILAETGYRFEIVDNGRKALEAFARSRPLMILMDVSMPEMNGHEATAEIRRMEEDLGTRVPIVGVTAHALKGDCERCLEAGMDDYLAKPISPKALLEKLARWLGKADRTSREAGAGT